MKVYLAADHNGLAFKDMLRDWLREEGYEVEDLGPEQFNKYDDYPDYAFKLGEKVAENPADHFGIGICASGVGMSVAADKVPGVRAGLIHDPAIAAAARRDDDINILALGSAYITAEQAKAVVRAWLTAEFSGAERHTRRIGKIEQYEREHASD